MPNPRKLDKRRRSIRNIRKITRTMELIATARFKKAMDRATAATAYTRHMQRLMADLIAAGRMYEGAAAVIEDAIYMTEEEDQAELADREGWKKDTR